MDSLLPPDPYIALGVPKDADSSQIKSAYRKLALRCHPDRIKGDDVEAKTIATDEFQKVQQAYELLLDPSSRSRYDANVKRLAELKKMSTREPPRPTPSARNPTSEPHVVGREMRSDGNFYETRAPPTSYFDSKVDIDDPLPRAFARKHETPYEKERKTSAPKTVERKDKPSSRMANPVEGISINLAFNLKAKAQQAKEKLRENRARDQEVRDREKRRERSDKHSGRRTAYVEEIESESDSGTEVPRNAARAARQSPRRRPEPESSKSYAPPPRRPFYHDDDEASFDEDEKWERHHKSSMDYIAESQKRPTPARSGSDAYRFWDGDRGYSGRRSGSDTEKRPSSSRRSRPDESKIRPSMPVHSSAPSNLKPYVEDRVPQRSKTNPYPAERDARPMPSMARSHTMPTKPSRKDAAPTRGSNLKHAETQDSGYYSSSNHISSSPVSPEMKQDSPPPSRENSKKNNSSTKYRIVDPEDEDDRASHVRILGSDDEGRRRRYRSPEPERRDRVKERERDSERDRDGHRDRERERDRDRDRDRADRDRPREREKPLRTDSDSKTRRPPPQSFPRETFARYESASPRGSPPSHRQKLYGEISSDEKEIPYKHRYDSSNVKTAAYRPAATASYANPRFRDADEDHMSNAALRESVRYNNSRRPSVVH